MLLIHCPFCGPRNESEFTYGGPALAQRAEDPAAMSDADWVDCLTVPPNPMGWLEERWWHARGCGSWLTIRRHTVTHAIDGVRHGR